MTTKDKTILSLVRIRNMFNSDPIEYISIHSMEPIQFKYNELMKGTSTVDPKGFKFSYVIKYPNEDVRECKL
jgi:hypothetical protein